MRHLFLALIFITTVTAGLAAPLVPASSFVNDFAEVIAPETESALAADLALMRQETGIEFTVVTIKSMRDHGHTGEIEPFATDLFNQWGVGDAERNDGVMILVAVDDRQMRIELGFGYGRRLNVVMQEIVDDVMLPRFRNQAYGKGIALGADEVSLVLTDRYLGEHGQSKFLSTAKRWATPRPWWIVVAIGGAGLATFLWGRGICPSCGARRLKRQRKRLSGRLSRITVTCSACGYHHERLSHDPPNGPTNGGFGRTGGSSSRGGSFGGGSTGGGGGASGRW